MSLAAAIMGRLGLDTKPFSDEMRKVPAIAESGARKAEQSFASNFKLGSNRKVSRQISGFFNQLGGASDFASIASSGVMAFGKSLGGGVSIGLLAAIPIAGELIKGIAGIRSELNGVNQESDKFTHGMSVTTSGMTARFQKSMEMIAKLRSESGYTTGKDGEEKAPGIFARGWRNLKDNISQIAPSGNDQADRDGREAENVRERNKADRGLASEQNQLNALHGKPEDEQALAKLRLEWQGKIGEAVENNMNEVAASLHAAWKLAEKDLTDKIAAKKAEAVKESLKDLPQARAEVVRLAAQEAQRNSTPQTARGAARLYPEGQGNGESYIGKYGEKFPEPTSYLEKYKNQFPPSASLKDRTGGLGNISPAHEEPSKQGIYLTNALNQAEVLQKIEKNTSKGNGRK